MYSGDFLGMTQFKFQYVMFMNKKTMFLTTNKENEPVQQASKTTRKSSVHLGKMIKCKAHIMPSYSPILKQQKNIQNQSSFIQPLKFNQQMTNALMNQPIFDLDDISIKNKSVRFEDQNTFGSDSRVTLQFSRNKKKSTSILKKSNSIDKMSVDSCNSDLGQLDFLKPKNSLKDKGLACSNDKYFKEVKNLKYENVKFFDKIFPPGGASLCYSKQKISEFKNVRWVRIQDVFKGKKLVLYSQQNHLKGIFNKGAFNYGYNFAVACNSLSNSNRCLQRIFEDQKVNGLCIYYLRINQDGIWKYTIVDDYIPVLNLGGVDFPAFMSVCQNQLGQIQLWPFLLQKAFAKIYNCYQSLFDDSVENLLFDFTGFPSEDIDLGNQADQFKFRSSLTHAHSVAIVSKPLNSSYFTQECYPLREDKGPTSSAYFSLQTRMKLMQLKKYKNLVFQINDIKKQFKKAKIYSINDSYYSLGCIIKQAKGTISLRKFIIKQRTASCILNLIQKDKKYYHNNGYQYIWSRIMVVMKDGSNGYRWIDGKYKNERINSLYLNLQPGEYFVVMNGDWNNKVFQMYLNYQGNQEIQFVRQTIDKYPTLLTQMCIDIAQRFGDFKQINRNLCSYSLIDRTNGFLIQNVNNQVNRPIFYHKSYPLKGKNYELMDKNIQFEDQQNVVEIKIQANSHFTFIVKLVNGYDCELLDNFNFY